VIEVNLLPGGRKRSGKAARFSFSLPKLGGGKRGGGLPRRDAWTLGSAAAVIVALLGSGWLFFAVAGQAEDLQVQIEAAEGDSVRFADVMERSATLQARSDTIAQRVAIIQDIDGDRYVWAHLMDEVGRALADYTWLTRFFQVSRGEEVAFRLEGRAGQYFALTSLMENLEASPYIRGVELISSEQTQVQSADGITQLVYEFVLEAASEPPPPEIVETVPLFGSAAAPPGEGI
jgi:Tfp pilus assembly protein PilN